jgi:hypothetical protein
MTDVRRSEVPFRTRGDEILLRAEGCRAPKVRTLVFMMTVRPQHEELLPDEECRGAMTQPFSRLWQSEADASDS